MQDAGLRAFQAARDLTIEKVKKSAEPANRHSGMEAADFFEMVFNSLLGPQTQPGAPHPDKKPKKLRPRADTHTFKKSRFAAETALLFAVLLLAYLLFKHLVSRITLVHEINIASPKL